MTSKQKVIAVVGPCAAGKSTLVSGLAARGIQARHVAQEHSYVPDMWKQMTDPDFLVYLDVSYLESNRRTGSSLKESIFRKQVERLQHAKKHANIIIDTDTLHPGQVLQRVLDALPE